MCGGELSGSCEIWRSPAFNFVQDAIDKLAINMWEGSTLAVNNPTAVEIVGRDFNKHSIARNDSDEVLSHLAGYVSQYLVSIFQLDSELGVGQSLGNFTFDFNGLFFRHQESPPGNTRMSP